MKTTGQIFIENLRRLRKVKFSSQDLFATAVGMSERGYQKYEQGESSPTPDILDRFARELGCEPWQLVQPDDYKKESSNRVADMSIEDLETLVSKASKRDGTINLELERLKRENFELRAKVNLLPQEFWTVWAEAKSRVQAAFLYLLLGKKEYLNRATSPATRDLRKMLDLLRKDLAPTD